MYELLTHDKDILGEACGIFAGDGGLYATARSAVLEIRGTEDEMDYYQTRVKPLFEKILDRKLAMNTRSYQGGHSICIRACGVQAMKIFHIFLQFPVGNKSGSLRMPKLICNNHEYWKAYLRGMFDTRGTVYMRRTAKRRSGEGYRGIVMEISSPSIAHLLQLKEIARDMGFHFWLEKRNLKMRMAGKKNAERFFKEISPHNNTKLEKFARIMRTKK